MRNKRRKGKEGRGENEGGEKEVEWRIVGMRLVEQKK